MTLNTDRNGETNPQKEELCLFHSTNELLQSTIRSCKMLNSLIVIGQKVNSIDGIQYLCNLEELWLVEADLTQEVVGPLEQCHSIKKLYIYDNKLSSIPDLTYLTKLTHLWISNNRITSFQNVNKMLSVKDLNLANNFILDVNVKLRTSLKIVSLNLSGNPLGTVKEVHKLSPLRRLRWLVFADPLYKQTPFTLTAHYRTYVINCLPLLEGLDSKPVSASERKKTSVFFDTKLQYYRSMLHSASATLWASRKMALEDRNKELEMIWAALHGHGPSDEKTESTNNNLRFWEGEAQRWNDRRGSMLKYYEDMHEVVHQKIQLELEYCGNVCFEEINQGHPTYNSLKRKIDSFLCPDLRDKVTETELLNMWRVRGPYASMVQQYRFDDSLDDVMILSPVQHLCTNQFELIESFFFGNRGNNDEVEVCSCLVAADTLVSDFKLIHRQLLLRSPELACSRMMILAGLLSKTDHSGPHLCTTQRSTVVPLYLVHFKYLFQDYFKQLKVHSVTPGQLSLPNLEPILNITQLSLRACNLKQLDLPILEKVKSLNLSYNNLQDVSSLARSFPKLVNLDLSFNRIRSLVSLKIIETLQHVVLKWNFLLDFPFTLRKLKELKALRQVDLQWNPWSDLISPECELFLVCHNLDNLEIYNGQPVTKSITSNHVTLRGHDQFPTLSAWRRSCIPITVRLKSQLCAKNGNSLQGCHLGLINDRLACVSLRGARITYFRSVLSLAALKWLDLSRNLITSLAPIRGLLSLEEVDMSHNVIECLGVVSERFRNITRLDLSHNYISSLPVLGDSFPNLKCLDLSQNQLRNGSGLGGLLNLVEIYLSHNLLQDCDILTHFKPMKNLKVVDVSYNPVNQDDTFKITCLYYITSLQYINGCKVGREEVKSAAALYGGVLDTSYLSRTHSCMDNITQLSLASCSLNKVELPDNSLPHVTSLILDQNRITCLSWVSAFPALSRLSLGHNKVSCYSDQPSTCPRPSIALRNLLLNHNRLSDLTPLHLDLFPNLRMLALNDNQLTNLNGVRHNIQLQVLVLDRNKLTFVSSDQTEKLQNLQELYLERNSLTSLDFLISLKKLRKLFVGFNKVLVKASLTPLAELPELEELTVHGNPLFKHTRAYKECFPPMPSLKLLEGHPVTKYKK